MNITVLVCPSCRVQFEGKRRGSSRCPACGTKYREATTPNHVEGDSEAGQQTMPPKASEAAPGSDRVTLGDGDAASAAAFLLFGLLLLFISAWRMNLYWAIPAVLFLVPGAFDTYAKEPQSRAVGVLLCGVPHLVYR
jgi:hypothetical protein